ncbi:FAD-dependent oxidoreductase [Taibaiella chishuiensis]|uniref:Kynurenine 3-monooxygenase n=1 Tax=Taibaiella chishuiensis TaxID=1434707 RepID=A0A2P8D9R2_9BACT|nr:NAD(P)/FAD-dependent oxidoreductase [Taibaiella chishuiensis]PSK93955.1 kynurenine 3-monooxygenase [Taibaiella chishuiensis]
MSKRAVTILGAGLVGSVLAVLLRKRGYEVTIYERRPDMRKETIGAGRSINLAMSNRGWKALELAGLREDIEAIAIPMPGRFLHQEDGSSAFQAYGKNGEAIYSVSRGELNKKLMDLAEQHGARILFNQRCSRVDVAANTIFIQQEDGSEQAITCDLLFGADGAFSALRTAMSFTDRTNFSQFYIEAGYKELNIPAGPNGAWQIEKNALHIWPRHNYMMIALPNTDGSFTCTLFFPFEGNPSFAALKTEAEVQAFFQAQFPDAIDLMPTLVHDFMHNPVSSLITTKIFPWRNADRSCLIGDAAHAIVPFYGQGMNAGFEDCSVLEALMEEHGEDWETILRELEQQRKPNADAVADLALNNFIEMRDKVADPVFLERKKIEKELGRRYAGRFNSVYEMVSFSHTPYAYALHCTKAQDVLLGRIMAGGDFFTNIEQPEYAAQVEQWLHEYEATV